MHLAALACAEQGYRVFPLYEPVSRLSDTCTCPRRRRCGRAGKHPRISGGHKNASTDPGQINEWWTKWPNANIGIATGDGLVALDVDPRNGGEEELAKLVAEHGPLGDTYTVRTGSGGAHYYFRVSDEYRSRTGFRFGLDIKCRGGYVVAPPSKHPDGEYTVEATAEVAPAPPWLLEILEEQRTGRPREAAVDDEALLAPGDTPEERVRWTRDAVKAIPNDSVYLSRGKWIGMAYAIRNACGGEAEAEALEIFEEFSQGWKDGYCDPEETRRVWETLGPSWSTKGYDELLDEARDHGYQYPPEHPLSAQTVFEEYAIGFAFGLFPTALDTTDTSPLAAALRQLDGTWELGALPDRVKRARALFKTLSGLDSEVFKWDAIAKINNTVGSHHAGKRIWDAADSAEAVGIMVVDGTAIIEAAQVPDFSHRPSFLVDDLIPSGAVGELIADYSCGKTMLLVNLALSISFGLPFLGADAREGRVLYLAYEGQPDIWKRVAAWLHDRGLLPSTYTRTEFEALLNDRFHLAALPPRFDAPSLETLLRDSVDHYQADLVIVDTRNKSLGQDQLEDSADTAGYVQSVLSRVAQETGCTCISAHHTGLSAGTRGRGSSAWTQGADFAFLIRGKREDFAAGKPLSLEPTKFRDGEWPTPRTYRLESGIDLEVDGTAFTGATIRYVSPFEGAELSLQAEVFAVIRKTPGCSGNSLRNGVEGKNTAIDEAASGLIARGAARDEGADNRHRYFGHRYFAEPGWDISLAGEVERVPDFQSASEPAPAAVLEPPR
jgi:hypothetical protein